MIKDIGAFIKLPLESITDALTDLDRAVIEALGALYAH
jgi:hypothetical protein